MKKRQLGNKGIDGEKYENGVRRSRGNGFE
jgi:hypothetical protein